MQWPVTHSPDDSSACDGPARDLAGSRRVSPDLAEGAGLLEVLCVVCFLYFLFFLFLRWIISLSTITRTIIVKISLFSSLFFKEIVQSSLFFSLFM